MRYYLNKKLALINVVDKKIFSYVHHELYNRKQCDSKHLKKLEIKINEIQLNKNILGKSNII